MRYSKNRAQLLGATRTLLATLTPSATEKNILQASIEALMDLLQVKYGAIGMLDKQGNLTQFVHSGISEEEAGRIMPPPQGHGLLGVVIQKSGALRMDNMAHDPRGKGFPANHPQMTSLLAVPISSPDRVYGRIYLCDKFDKNAFSEEDEKLALSFANAISLILDNARKMKELEQEQNLLIHSAFHDPLTNLPNRVLLCDRIGQVLSHANRSRSQAAIMFCDLDGFKNINDSLGHQAGDQVLKTMGERLINCVRENDTVARIGGDEFVFVMSEIDSVEHTGVVAQKILDTISQHIHIDGCEVQLSGSIGIAIYPFDGDATERLMKNADAAMYEAKKCGKNNYKFYTEKTIAGCGKQASLFA